LGGTVYSHCATECNCTTFIRPDYRKTPEKNLNLTNRMGITIGNYCQIIDCQDITYKTSGISESGPVKAVKEQGAVENHWANAH
jgi:hypothetical protein